MSNTLSETNILDFSVLTVQHGEKFVTLYGLITNTDPRLTDARVANAHTHPESDVVGLVGDLALRQLLAQKDAAGGYAGLLDDGLLSGAQQRYGMEAATACVGNDSRLSDARTPTGPAGGDLAGTYPNPLVVGLQGFKLPAMIGKQFFRRNAGNSGWEPGDGSRDAADITELETSFNKLLLWVVGTFGEIPPGMENEYEQALQVI